MSRSTCFLREAFGLLALVVPFVMALVWHIFVVRVLASGRVVRGEKKDTSSAFTTLNE